MGTGIATLILACQLLLGALVVIMYILTASLRWGDKSGGEHWHDFYGLCACLATLKYILT